MSVKYFSDKNYKYLSPAEKAGLWKTRKKRTGNDSNPSPPPSMINQVKRKISELKFTFRDMEKGWTQVMRITCSVTMMITSKSIPENLY